MRSDPTSAEMLARLVAFDTTSRNSNLALIDAVRAHLDAYGISYRISANEDGSKANLHAIIGPPVAGGLALAGHVDTVPVDGQDWHSDPFALRRADGRLYARGSADMKGFVACALAALPRLRDRNLARPMHLFITYDEETTCAGARRLVADLGDSGLRPEFCVVGEPTLMRPVIAHKGKLDVRVEVRGHAGHSSEPARGVNAVHAAAEAIAWIAAEGRRLAAEGPFEDGFEPPYTTVHVGTVGGGTILNIIPAEAQFMMEWRTIPADDAYAELERLRAVVAEHIEPAMKRVDPSSGFTFHINAELPGLSLDPAHPLVGIVQQVTGANSATKVSYGTEAGIFQREGNIPSIICGPGDIAQAHRADEFVAEQQLAACDTFIDRITERLLV
ncbi:MAG TPA: acetylornithine deacetylase [Acidisphaera sp.]|nr:acetylornithine deacetylase [Acidisphaera sp.]